MNPRSPDLVQRSSEDFDIFRRVVAFSTSDSWKRVPHVSWLYDPDVTDFHAFYRDRCRIVTLPTGETMKITFGTVLLKVIAEALVAAPRLNSFLRYRSFGVRGRLSVQNHVNVTLPWLLDTGKVLTVVVPRAESLSIVELQDTINRLGARIESSNIVEVLNRTALHDTMRKIGSGEAAGFARILSLILGLTRLDRLRGSERREYYSLDQSERLTAGNIDTGTVVVSNVGSLPGGLPGRFGLLDIVAPQVFAVGISALQERPAVVRRENGEKTVEIRSILPLCLVFDHRAFELGELVPFVRRMDHLFAHPEELLPLLGA